MPTQMAVAVAAAAVPTSSLEVVAVGRELTSVPAVVVAAVARYFASVVAAVEEQQPASVEVAVQLAPPLATPASDEPKKGERAAAVLPLR